MSAVSSSSVQEASVVVQKLLESHQWAAALHRATPSLVTKHARCTLVWFRSYFVLLLLILTAPPDPHMEIVPQMHHSFLFTEQLLWETI